MKRRYVNGVVGILATVNVAEREWEEDQCRFDGEWIMLLNGSIEMLYILDPDPGQTPHLRRAPDTCLFLRYDVMGSEIDGTLRRWALVLEYQPCRRSEVGNPIRACPLGYQVDGLVERIG